ncbi:MAG: penicillin-binding protein 2 [Candidatus Staskawiczbacteria bacterium RIFCSPLOWO2_01_FULL_40_39]|uniref:Penicillin-binding protein 2 n=1 Tax=Candidatus Staskawiczbacteria bacterium RIFCSPHIGHO2_01_FULL_39_25 TaxID=1802202 RepID=A0A1G2HPX0_9BACT|nr:MAG: penicillin-binding protein 2 [Candidatus Staskawiczbacteria bacterium RIFCSPHIGHO2_01_FULL_39_25]OGZ72869.1 MAG: penicillin-binding protein 2 [Candidatus Staskawiczbacteria bacterium RIFCSPLOWO2_01_FULL_40_39]
MVFRKKYNIKESLGNIETHEVFLDTLARAKEEELGISEKKFEVEIKEKIIYFIFGLFFLLALTLFFKTFYWQVIEGKRLYTLSQNNKGKINLITPERGIIYDKNLKKLVLNSAAYDLVCDKRNFSESNPESVKEITQIAQVLGKNVFELEDIIGKSEESEVLIAENVNQETLLVLEARMNEFPDCQIEKSTLRNYVLGPIFSHVLGYTSKIGREELKNTGNYTASDYIGKVGLEKSYESFLRGIPGRVEIIKNAVGVAKGDKILSSPTSGYNLVLNIDAGLQKKVYDALEKSIKNIGSKKGAAVALDPRTGAVLALVSYPAYDDNIFAKGISQQDFDKLQNDPSQPFFNRAIAAQYPTGSTIKPFLASAALQEHLISPDKIINDPGYIVVHSQYDPSVTYKFAGVVPHGLVDMREAIAVSSNIYFYTVGGGYGDQKGLGPSRIKQYLGLFGWDQKTGIDIPGEYKGFVPSPEWKKQVKKEDWWDGDTYNLSIGQSDLQVTPLQVAVAYSAIANGGTLYKPQIVQKITDSSGGSSRIIQEFKPEMVSQNFINPEYLQIVREGMRDGVRKPYGSSFMLNNLPVAVAGKTGTAEIGRAGVYNTWSSNFAPYENPEIVFVATIEGVEGLRSATLPVAHEVLQYYFSKK